MSNRANSMRALYQQGWTLQSIGTKYRLTRERVRQILNKHFGTTAINGGNHIRKLLRAERMKHQQEKRYRLRFGCTREQLLTIPVAARLAWRTQRRNSARRGILFELSVMEFWNVWDASGKWSQRGRGAGRFCMSRIDERSGYLVGNVRVIDNSDNARLARLEKPCVRREKDKQGVYLLLPGYYKPYGARYGRKFLGFFETEEEAYAARHKYVAEKLAA